MPDGTVTRFQLVEGAQADRLVESRAAEILAAVGILEDAVRRAKKEAAPGRVRYPRAAIGASGS